MHRRQRLAVVPTRGRYPFTDQFAAIGVKDDAFYLCPTKVDAYPRFIVIHVVSRLLTPSGDSAGHALITEVVTVWWRST